MWGNLMLTGVQIIFLFLAQNIDYEYSLGPPRLGGSSEHQQSIFWSKKKKKKKNEETS